MKNLKKILSRQLKILFIIPIFVVIATLIYSHFLENKSGAKFVEAKFMWELYHIDTRGIVVENNSIVSQIFIANPKTIESHITTNIDGFILEANKNNCKIDYQDWLKAKFIIKAIPENVFMLELNEFDSTKVTPCKDFVHDYLVEYISGIVQEYIKIDTAEIDLLNRSMDIYKNRLNSTLKDFEKIFSTDIGQKQIFQDRYFGQYISYLSSIETQILNLSIRVTQLENLEKKLKIIFSTVKESKKFMKIFARVFIAFIFSMILCILYIAVIESKAVGRYFR